MIDSINKYLEYSIVGRGATGDSASFKKLLTKLNNPEQKLKCIHITGTNGKGSTSKLIADILISSGYKVGLFTSPHLEVFNDRIRINDRNISDDDFLMWFNKYQDLIEEYSLTFFEINMLISIMYYIEQDVDYVIYEVGIGGRLDATNVIDGFIAVITNVGFDHQAQLGNTLAAITNEKAQIIKANSHVVTGVTDKICLNIIEQQVKLQAAHLYQVNMPSYCHQEEGIAFTYDDIDYYLPTAAVYQVYNAALALQVIEILKKDYKLSITDETIKQALCHFQWKGRFEIVKQNPKVIIDGAHNILGIKLLLESLKAYSQQNVVIFSALKDKDYPEMLQLLMSGVSEVVFCQFDYYRALKKVDLAGYNINKFTQFNEAYQYLTSKYPTANIIVCGSLYFISEIRQEF